MRFAMALNCWLLFGLPMAAGAQQQGWIEGMAVNKLTKAPVAGVKVRMTAASEADQRYEAVTDHNGAYRIDDVPFGDYLPAFDAPAGFYGPNPMEFVARRSRVHVARQGARFDMEVVPASTIRGRVLDAKAQPVAGATIFALPIDGVRLGTARTDDKGQFAVAVPPGRYRLQARPEKGGQRAFYPDVADAAAAEAIPVGEGADLGGYDIRLPGGLQRKLRGVVRDPAGNPAPDAEVVLSTPAVLIEQVGRVKADAKGAFEFASVASGLWQIAATARRQGAAWLGRTNVTMGNRDLDGVEVRIAPPFAWDVEISGVPEDRLNVIRIELRSAEGNSTDYAVAKPGEPARFSGIYPGTYRVSVAGFISGVYLESIQAGALEVSGRTIEVGPGSPPLHLVYSAAGGGIAGAVENGKGAQVVLVWANRNTSIAGQDILTVNCNDAGRFSARDLRPGDWYAFAIAGPQRMMPATAIRESVFDRGLWRQAETIHVRANEATGASLKLASWPD